jgi:hypothetical protein
MIFRKHTSHHCLKAKEHCTSWHGWMIFRKHTKIIACCCFGRQLRYTGDSVVRRWTSFPACLCCVITIHRLTARTKLHENTHIRYKSPLSLLNLLISPLARSENIKIKLICKMKESMEFFIYRWIRSSDFNIGVFFIVLNCSHEQ